VIAGAVLASLSGCGDDGGGHDKGPAETDTVTKHSGRFLDVEGLAYSSGLTTGTTEAAGEFQYEVTEHVCLTDDAPKDCRYKLTTAPVSFHLLRDVELWSGPLTSPTGSAPHCLGPVSCHHRVTRFVSTRTVSDDPVVQRNVGLVLEMTDADGNPDNGIQIPAAVRDGTFGGDTVNWSSTGDPRIDFATLRDRVRQLDPSGSHEWPATDDKAAAHFEPVWNCAMTGRYTGSYGGFNAPRYTDTNGLQKILSGKYALIVLPTGTVAQRAMFSDAPWQFTRGVFRFSGALQPGAPAFALTSEQYVDGGRLAPVSNPSDVTLQTNILLEGSGYPTVTWGDDGGQYGGQTAEGSRAELGRGTNPNGNSEQRDPQPMNAVYRFGVYPIWLSTRHTTFPGDFREMHWQLDIDSKGKVWGSLSNIEWPSDTNPVAATLGASNGITIENTATEENRLPKPYEWRFDGHFDEVTGQVTGTWNAYDGTTIVWDSTHPLQACTTRGRFTPVPTSVQSN
jgi:hypothetical protein